MRQPLTIRLTPEAREALQRLASRESRSLASWIENQIRQEALAKGAWAPKALAIRR